MPKASPIRSTFNAGELSPLMDGRVDVAKYQNGCRVLENFIPSVQGPAVRRPGTRYVAEVKNSANRTWLVKFEFNVTQSFILEFGHQYIRFYTNEGQVQSSGSPYEVATPYTAANLTGSDGTLVLDFVQSGDVIYIVHPSYPVKKLSRFGNTNWTLTDVDFTNGPFNDQNTTKTTTVYASAATGTVTLTASSSIFNAGHVGALFYLEPKDLALIKPWTAGQEYTTNPVNTLRRSEGKTYKCTTSGTPSSGKVWRTGGNKPIHTYGVVADGDGSAKSGTVVEREGLDWEFVDNGWGYVKITAVASGTSATATVVDTLPDGVVSSGQATFRWAFGAFNGVEGYPSKVTFFRERLTFAKGQKLYFSVAGDFENFAAIDDAGDVVADRAIQVTISSDDVNPVEWMVPTQALIIGTAGQEFACSENATNEAFAPANVKIAQQSSDGSRAVKPVRVGYSTLFVQRSGRKLKECAYNFQQDGYITNDMTVLAEHITLGGVQQMVWHKEPYVALWAVRGDGKLLGFTFNKEQEVIGWHRHQLGGNGIVESVAVISAPDKTRDTLWMIVRRTIGGTTKRYVEFMDKEYVAGDAQEDAYYVDCGATYDSTPTTSITGLTWLAGQTVQVLADGAAHPDVTVSAGGVATLVRSASVVQIGFACPATLQTNRIEAGAGDGTAQGKTKRINKVVVRFYNTLGGFAGPDADNLDEVQFREGSDPMDEAPPLFSGDKLIEWPDGYNFDGYVMVKQTQPLPMTVVAIMPLVHTFDR